MNIKLPSPLKIFEPAPLIPALGVAGVSGGHIMQSTRRPGASGGGSRQPDDDYDYEYDDTYDDDDFTADDENVDEMTVRPAAQRSVRSRSANSAGGRTVTSSYQPEERYWSDYLRIALPIVGLLLLLGLLWFWATNLIGDKKDTTQPSDGTNVAVVRTSTPEPTDAPADLTATNTPASSKNDTNTIGISTGKSSTPSSVPTPTTAPQVTTTESTPNASSKTFKAQDVVTVTDDDVNMRSDPSTSASSVAMLKKGDQLTIVSGPEEADGYTWWNVVDSQGNSGFVVQEFLEPAN